MYRSIEVQTLDHNQFFGAMKASEITRQMAYSLYEQNVLLRGHDSANKAMSAWSAAFRYGTFKYAEITSNPFSDLEKLSSAPRRQRWTLQQLDGFIKKAKGLGFPSIGRCALMFMELMQRPGDVLSLTWDAYHEANQVWQIRQSKRGAVVRVPETRRLRLALDTLRRNVKRNGAGESKNLVCPTVTGRRWHRRNFTKAVRYIARAAGLRTMERTAPTNLLFLDACRNNPLARNLARAIGTRSGEIKRGLAPVEAGFGTLISFSTQPGNVALDGVGRNSPFAGALVKHLLSSNEEIMGLLVDVRNDVIRETNRQQVPWEHTAMTGRFYFK
jgi:hypothetical protein